MQKAIPGGTPTAFVLRADSIYAFPNPFSPSFLVGFVACLRAGCSVVELEAEMPGSPCGDTARVLRDASDLVTFRAQSSAVAISTAPDCCSAPGTAQKCLEAEKQ